MATTYTVTPAPATVSEGGQVTFTITRSGDKPNETIFLSARSDGTATWGEGDFSTTAGNIPLNIPVSFGSGVTSQTVTLNITSDGQVDSGEQFRVILQRSSSDAASVFLAQSSLVTINDAAQNTSYTVSPSPTTVTEGGQVTFTVTRSGDKPNETVFFSARSDGTATWGEGDFSTTSGTIPLNIAVNFGSGVTSQTVTLNIANDGQNDSGEQFRTIVQRSSSDAASVFLAQSGLVTINDAAQNTSYSLTPSPTTATEGGQVTFTITRTGDKPSETVFFSARSDGTATWSEGDFSTTSGTIPLNMSVNFGAGVTSQTVTLNIANDGVSDSGEQFRAIVQRSSSDAASVFLAQSSAVTINDAVQNTTYSLTPSPTTVTEGGQVTFTITRSGDKPNETVFFSARSDGSANWSEGDFSTTSGTIPLNLAVSFGSGVTSQTVTLNITNDGVSDSGEQFRTIVQRNSTDDASVFLAQSGFVTVNDPAAQNTTYVLTPSVTTAAEGSQVTFTATRSGDKPAETLFFSARSDGSANWSEGDFSTTAGTIPLNIAVNFGSGVTSQSVTMNINSDGVSDSGEQFRTILQRNSSDDASVFLAQSGFVTINDAGQNTGYTITPSSSTANEGGQVTFTITRTGDKPGETVFFSARADGSANWSEGDFSTTAGTIPLNIPVNFGSGVASQTVTLNINNDGVSDSGEQFRTIVQRNSMDDASVFLAQSGFLTINEGTQNTTYSVAPSPASVTEGNTTLTFTVTRSGELPPETIYFSTVHGAANGYASNTNDSDYVGRANVPLTFGANVASQQVTITIKDDALVEGNETFGTIVQRNTTDPLTTFLAKRDFTIVDNEAAAIDDYASSPSTVGIVDVNGVRNGNIETVGDTDWFKVSLTAGHTYQFDLQGSPTSHGTLADPYLSIRNPGSGTTKLKEDDDGGTGVDSRFTYTPQATDTYFLATGSGNGGIGTYRIQVSDISAAATPTALTTRAQDIFTAHGGKVLFLADLAETAYHLHSLENASSGYNGTQAMAESLFASLFGGSSPALHLLTSTDVPNLAPVNAPTNDSRYVGFPTIGLVDGIYTNSNAAVLAGRSSDALFLAFRGTNDDPGLTLSRLVNPVSPDEKDWVPMDRHYGLYADFLNQIKSYLGAHTEISKVYITGHSLGAAMAQKFMADNPGNLKYEGIVFANPGYDEVSGIKHIFDSRFVNIRVDFDPILAAPILAQKDIRGDTYIIDDRGGLLNDPSFLQNHDMGLYLEIAKYLVTTKFPDPLAQNNNRVDPDIEIPVRITTASTSTGYKVEAFNGLTPNDFISDAAYVITVIDGANNIVGNSIRDVVNFSVDKLTPIAVDLASGVAASVGWAVSNTLTGIYNVFTGAADDIIKGNSLTNWLFGGAGDDEVSGLGGDDFIIGGSGEGNDFYDGGEDIDTVIYSSAIQSIIVDLTTGQVSGIDIGADRIINIENVVGGSGDDLVTGNALANLLDGGTGNDVLRGLGGDDVLVAGIDADESAAPTQLTLKPGSEGQDLWVTSTFSYSDNYGVDDAFLKVGGWADYYHSLLRFDLSGAGIPAHVTSATLRLYNTDYSDYSPTGMYVDRLNTAWTESYGWHDYSLSYTNITSTAAPGPGWIDINVTAAVNQWLDDPTSNFGLQLRPVGNNHTMDYFVSSDATGAMAQYRPELVLAIEPGSAGDILDGGDGIDTADYSATTLGIVVDLSAAQDQAVGGEIGTDQITAVENVIGGSGNDQITGSAGANRLEGGAGNDILRGDGDGFTAAGNITATVQGTIVEFDGSGFDATRVESPTVVKVGNAYKMLYGGLPFANNYQIGLATSADGTAWTKSSSDPVISNGASQSWASFREIPVSLMYEDGTYKLWFYGDNRNLNTNSGYATGFGYATSADGVTWSFSADNPIRVEPASPGNGISLREVVKLGGAYHAYFYDNNPGGNILKHAASSDGVHFSGDTAVSLPSGYTLVAATTTSLGGADVVFAVLDQNGTKYHAISSDGLNFSIGGTLSVPADFAINDILFDGGELKLFGTAGVGNVNWNFGNEVIRYATAPLSAAGSGDDVLSGGLGNDTLIGGGGSDTAIFSGKRSQYQVSQQANGDIIVTDLRTGANDGTDTVREVENFNFADGTFTAATVLNNVPQNTNPIVNQSSAEDQVWSFQVPANAFADIDGDGLSYAAALGDGSALPAWLAFSAATRTFSGTPPANFNGALDLKVTASDDGLSASGIFTVTITPVNDAPTMAAPNTYVGRGQVVSAASLFSSTDVEADALSYWFRDNTVGGGRFEYDGAAQVEGQTFGVSQAQLSHLTFRAGTSGSDDIFVNSWDGAASSSVVEFHVNVVNHAPTMTAPDASLGRAKVVSAASLFTASDADGDALTYWFRDNTVGNGRFEYDGVPQTEGQTFGVSQAQLSHLTFRSGTSGSDDISVHAYDGLASSNIAGFHLTVVNHAPTVSAPDASLSRGQVVSAASLFTAGDSDGDEISYWFRDNTPGGGRFEYDGTPQTEGQTFGVSQAQLSHLTFRAGTSGSDDISVNVYDGAASSAVVGFHANVVNHAPTMSASDVTRAPGQVVSAASLFTAGDVDSGNSLSYWFRDNTIGGGRFEYDGVPQAEGQTFGVSQAQLSHLTFRAAASGSDGISVNAWDGVASSSVVEFHVFV